VEEIVRDAFVAGFWEGTKDAGNCASGWANARDEYASRIAALPRTLTAEDVRKLLGAMGVGLQNYTFICDAIAQRANEVG
jgi:hypothetical protein